MIKHVGCGGTVDPTKLRPTCSICGWSLLAVKGDNDRKSKAVKGAEVATPPTPPQVTRKPIIASTGPRKYNTEESHVSSEPRYDTRYDGRDGPGEPGPKPRRRNRWGNEKFPETSISPAKPTYDKRLTCGCYAGGNAVLNKRHTIHITKDLAISGIEVKSQELITRAETLQSELASQYYEFILNKNSKGLESLRNQYKKIAKMYFDGGDLIGAVLADSIDDELDQDIDRMSTWTNDEYNRFLGRQIDKEIIDGEDKLQVVDKRRESGPNKAGSKRRSRSPSNILSKK